MDKYIPCEKLSKKAKRKLETAKRTTWGNLNPVTRKPENSKAYNRRKMQNWKKDLPNSASSFLRICIVLLLLYLLYLQQFYLYGYSLYLLKDFLYLINAG